MSQEEYKFEEFKTYVEAIKANIFCNKQRKTFSIAIANPITRFVQPQMAKSEAQGLINCFQRMLKLQDAGQRTKKHMAVQSLVKGEDATKLINNYVDS